MLDSINFDAIMRWILLLFVIIAADERVLAEPAPVIVLGELGDSSVNFLLRPWVNSSDYWALHWETNEKVKQTFDDNGISIPFPQMDVHMDQSAAESSVRES
jgi:small conductance mechanosensitive channel